MGMGFGLGLAMAGDASQEFKQDNQADQDRAETMLKRDYDNHQLYDNDQLLDPTLQNKLTDQANYAQLAPLKQATAVANASTDAGLAENKQANLPTLAQTQTFGINTDNNNAKAKNIESGFGVQAAPYLGSATLSGALSQDHTAQLQLEGQAGRLLQSGDPDSAMALLNGNQHIMGGKITRIDPVVGKDTDGNKAGFYKFTFDDGSTKQLPAAFVNSVATQYGYGAKDQVVPAGSTVIATAPGMPTQTQYSAPFKPFGTGPYRATRDGSAIYNTWDPHDVRPMNANGTGAASKQNTALMTAASKLAAAQKDPLSTDTTKFDWYTQNAPSYIERYTQAGKTLPQAVQAAGQDLNRDWAIKASRGTGGSGNAAPSVDLSKWLK